MEERANQDHVLRELALRVAALEDNVAFLEVWCEEQQDALDRVGECWYYEEETVAEPVRLRVVDLRHDDEPAADTDHDRKVRQLRARITLLRRELVTQQADEVIVSEELGAAATTAD